MEIETKSNLHLTSDSHKRKHDKISNKSNNNNNNNNKQSNKNEKIKQPTTPVPAALEYVTPFMEEVRHVKQQKEELSTGK